MIRVAALALLLASTEIAMAATATGSFEVKMAPQHGGAGEAGFSRLTLDKRWSGGVAGTSTGVMLGESPNALNSGAYVALERFTGTIDGRRGSLMFVHRGIMTRGAAELAIGISPDSGTGELAGIAGTLKLDLSGGGHRYTLDYTLPAAVRP